VIEQGRAVPGITIRPGWAREAGVEKVVLSVYPHDEAVVALYRTFGLVEEGRPVGPPGSPTGTRTRY